MADQIELSAGEEIDNKRLCEVFGCGPQGGMRRAHKTGTLVLISNHVESIYDDRWIGGVLHYTGMGQQGDQTLVGNQNKTLAESATNGVGVHLCEVHQPRVYTYVGEVTLAGQPYQETQVDVEGADSRVWVFPLAPAKGEAPPIRAEVVRDLAARREGQARRLSEAEIAARAARRLGYSVRLLEDCSSEAIP